MKTNFGNARLNSSGYYWITSSKEGNHGKYLHCLIWEDWYGKLVPKGYDIHHLNGDKLDNRIQNLQCVERRLHRRFHNKGKVLSGETKEKISKTKNSSGYYNVTKKNNPNCKQGFLWSYQYYENGKRKSIYSVNIKNLEEKVKSKGLVWEKF